MEEGNVEDPSRSTSEASPTVTNEPTLVGDSTDESCLNGIWDDEKHAASQAGDENHIEGLGAPQNSSASSRRSPT